jgi:hypothetical protein
VISMRASAAGDTTGKFEVLTGGAQRLSITDTFVTASAPGVFESGLSLSGGNLNLNAYANLIQLMNASVRQGYLRSDSGWAARMTAEVGPALVQSNTGYVRVQSNTDDVIFYANGTENGRFSAAGGYFLVGKTANDQAVVGFQVNPGSFCQSNATVNTPMGALNKVGAGVGAGHDFIHFRNNGTAIGSVTRNGTTSAVLYNTTSDYRLKNDLGPITNAIERIMMLKPRRITWKEDVTEQEQDAFLAHEVTPVAPWAVTGEKDAVADEDNEDAGRVKGEIIPQQLDSSRLIPLLTAAVQELTERVRELEGATA